MTELKFQALNIIVSNKLLASFSRYFLDSSISGIDLNDIFTLFSVKTNWHHPQSMTSSLYRKQPGINSNLSLNIPTISSKKYKPYAFFNYICFMSLQVCVQMFKL